MGLLQRLLQRLLVELGLSLELEAQGPSVADAAARPMAMPEAVALLPVWRGDRLLQGIVRGQRFVHNPAVTDGLVLLSPRAGALLDASDGAPLGQTLERISIGAASDPRWLGEARLLLRGGMIQHSRREQLTVDAWLGRRPAVAERTFDLWLHVTNDCNLDCPYCYIDKSKARMDDGAMARAARAIEAAAAAGHCERVHVRYAGGEPMLRFAEVQRFHADAVAACDRHGVRYTAAILTNGTVVPDGAPAWLRAHGVGLSVSIDGLGAAQDVMRPTRAGRGSWRHLARGLEAWRRGGVEPYVLVTLGDGNIDEAPALVRWLLAEGLAFRLSLVRDLELGRGDMDDRHGAQRPRQAPLPAGGILQGDALQRVLRPLMTAYDAIEAHVGAQVDAGVAVAPEFRAKHRFCDLSPFRPIGKACGAGSNYAAIGPAAAFSACQAALHHGDEVATLAGDRSIVEQARAHRPFGAFTRAEGNDDCRSCRHQLSCAGGCPLLLHRRDGHIDGRSPFCEVFRAVLPRIVRIAALELVGQRRRATATT